MPELDIEPYKKVEEIKKTAEAKIETNKDRYYEYSTISSDISIPTEEYCKNNGYECQIISTPKGKVTIYRKNGEEINFDPSRKIIVYTVTKDNHIESYIYVDNKVSEKTYFDGETSLYFTYDRKGNPILKNTNMFLENGKINYNKGENTTSISIEFENGEEEYYTIEYPSDRKTEYTISKKIDDGYTVYRHNLDGTCSCEYHETKDGIEYIYKQDGTYISYWGKNVSDASGAKHETRTIYEEGTYTVEDDIILRTPIDKEEEIPTIYGKYKTPDGGYEIIDEPYRIKVDNNGNSILYIHDNGMEQDPTFSIKVIQDKEKEYLFTTEDNKTVINFLNESKIEKINNLTYSKNLKCIDFDEDTYYQILHRLISIYSEKTKLLKEKININNIVSSFNEPYKNLEVSIDNHFELINTLKINTNKSMLAYQTYDSSLKDYVDKYLIENIFDMNTRNYWETIHDENISKHTKDSSGILTYTEDTNFNELNDIKITENNGNVIYFDKDNNIKCIEGNKPLKIGNQEFIYTNDNNVLVLRDLEGNPISIFGDYNAMNRQYGGDQQSGRIDDPYVLAVLKKYFPNATNEELDQVLRVKSNTGCGYTAFVNKLFLSYEGKEEEFLKTFGIPMYELKCDEYKGIYADYNYEPLILDYYCYTNSNDDVRRIIVEGDGSGIYTHEQYGVSWLKETYGIDSEVTTVVQYDTNNVLNITSEYDNMLISPDNYALYFPNNTETPYLTNGKNHTMTITETVKDSKGNIEGFFVSSWGVKYYMPVDEQVTFDIFDVIIS